MGIFSIFFLWLAQHSGLGALRALRRASVVLPFALLPLLLRGGAGSWSEASTHAARLGVKAWASALILVVLVATTPLTALCAAAERLRAPRALTQTILFTERYLRVLQRRLAAMMTSARLRGFTLRRRQEKVIGAMAGSLLLRTIDRADRVYHAMQARGYQGSLPQLSPLRFALRDLVAALLVLAWGLGLLSVTRGV